MKQALLVVDVQRIYTDPDSEMFCKDAGKTVKNMNRLVERFQDKKAPIYLIRHIHEADGSDLGRMFDYLGEPEEDFNYKQGTEEVEYDDRLIQPKGAIELVKTRYSAFAGTDLLKKLRSAGVDTVVVCGFMTNFCCESTARDAHDNDFFVDFILDATGTPGTENMEQDEVRRIVGEFMESGFSRVKTTDEYLSES